MRKNLVYLIILAVLVSGTYYVMNMRDTEYQITSTANLGGSIDPSGITKVQSGNDLTLTVTPETGYEIAEILVDTSSIGAIASYTFTDIESDHNIEASFTPILPVIEASAGVGGTIEPMGLVQVPYGESQLFTLQPVPGYELQELFVDEVSKGTTSSYIFEDTTSDHTIHAEFTLKEPDQPMLTVQFSNPEQVYDVEYSDDGRYLVTSYDFEVKYYDIEHSSPLWTSINAYEAINWDLVLSGDGDIMAVGDETGRINYYAQAHQRTGYQTPTWFSKSFGRGLPRDSMDISLAGEVIALGGVDGYIHFFINCQEKSGWDLPDDWNLDTTISEITKVKVSENGAYAAIGGHIETPSKSFIQISFIDINERKELWSYVSPFDGELFDLAISDNGYTVTASTMNLDEGSTGHITWNDATTLITGAEGNPGDPAPSWSYMITGETGSYMAVSDDASEISLANLDSLLFWKNAETISDETEPTWVKHLMVSNLAISMDGGTIITTHIIEGETRLTVYNQQGAETSYYEFDANLWLLKISTDGTRIVAASIDTLWVLEYTE